MASTGPFSTGMSRENALAAALHVSNGDATNLPATGLARNILYWRDALHEGPVPAVEPVELRRIRSAFLTDAGAEDRAEGAAMFAERDRTLEAHRDGRYVLWFEADLYDQLQIIQVLDRLAALDVSAQRIDLICIGEHPGIARFAGLGQLDAVQLRHLAWTNARATLTPTALELASRAWAAFRAPSPDGLNAVAATQSVELRFLGEAFDRLAREYPSTRDGLSLTERRALAAVRGGAVNAETAFLRLGEREARPYLGDTWFFATVNRLVKASTPLLSADPSDAPITGRTRLKLTRVGARVLAGKTDHLHLNGTDRWIGGVHLTGHAVPWRWDDGCEALTPRAE